MGTEEVSEKTLDTISGLADDLFETVERRQRAYVVDLVHREALLRVIVARVKVSLLILCSSIRGSSIQGVWLMPLSESRVRHGVTMAISRRESTESASYREGLYLVSSGNFCEIINERESLFLSAAQTAEYYSVVGIADRLVEVLLEKREHFAGKEMDKP